MFIYSNLCWRFWIVWKTQNKKRHLWGVILSTQISLKIRSICFILIFKSANISLPIGSTKFRHRKTNPFSPFWQLGKADKGKDCGDNTRTMNKAESYRVENNARNINIRHWNKRLLLFQLVPCLVPKLKSMDYLVRPTLGSKFAKQIRKRNS